MYGVLFQTKMSLPIFNDTCIFYSSVDACAVLSFFLVGLMRYLNNTFLYSAASSPEGLSTCVTLHSLADLTLHSLADLTLHSLADLTLHSLADLTLHSLADLTLHSLADLFIPTQTRLLLEAFCLAAITARRLFDHISTTLCSQVLVYTAE